MAKLLIQIDPALLATHPDHVAGHVVTVLPDDFPISEENRRTFAVVSCPLSVADARKIRVIDPALIPAETLARIAAMRAKRVEVRAEAKSAAKAAVVALDPTAASGTTRDAVERVAVRALDAVTRGKSPDALDRQQDALLAASRTAFRRVEDAALADLPLPEELVLTAEELA